MSATGPLVWPPHTIIHVSSEFLVKYFVLYQISVLLHGEFCTRVLSCLPVRQHLNGESVCLWVQGGGGGGTGDGVLVGVHEHRPLTPKS